MSRGMFRKFLQYDDLSFAVSSPVDSHLQWLKEFLCPHFSAKRTSVRPTEVILRIDREKFSRHERAFTAADTIPSFVFDSEVLHLPYLRRPRGGLRLYDEKFSAFYDVSEDRRSVQILIAEDRHSVRTPLMRILREYAMNEAHQGGDFFLHASSFISGRRAFVVAGPKNAGKTTLLIHACRQGGGRYLANDRVRVHCQGGRYALRGIPAIVSIRERTFAFFPRIKMEILSRGLHFRLNSDERAEDAKPPLKVKRRERWLVAPMQFCSLLRTRQVAEGKDPVVIMPSITGQPGTFVLRRMLPEEAQELLHESLFGARHWGTSTPVFNRSGEKGTVANDHILEECRRFTLRVPFFRCLVGEDLYRSRENARAWIRALGEEAAAAGS